MLGVVVCMFLALFAMDAFDEASRMRHAWTDLGIHLAPAAVLSAVVAASWRWAWVGGVVFIAFALVYATLIAGRLDWILVVSGPLSLVGVLFLWSWRHHTGRRIPR